MCSERNYSIFDTTTMYEVHTFKSKNLSFIYLLILSCKFVIISGTDGIAYDENAMRKHDQKGIKHGGKQNLSTCQKQPPVFYNKSCP